MRNILQFSVKVLIALAAIQVFGFTSSVWEYLTLVKFYETKCVPLEYEQVQVYWQHSRGRLVCNHYILGEENAAPVSSYVEPD